MSGIEKTCAICKYANHDPSLGERPEVICTISPNEPKLKDTNDTCLNHVSKYKSIKIIEDKGTLLEYDPKTETDKKISSEEYESEFVEELLPEPETGESEIAWDL